MTVKTDRYVEVFWTTYSDPTFNRDLESKILYAKPKPFYPLLLNARGGMPYMRCPAVASECQNDFVVCAPYDFVFTFDSTNRFINTDRFGQDFVDFSIKFHWGELPEGMPPLLQTPPRYIMYSFEDVEVEFTDLPIITSKFSSNVKIIRGAFNISKWYRPLELAFEVVDTSKPVIFEAEEPMCLMRLRTPNNVPVKLTRVEYTPELDARVHACTAVKNKRVGLKMPKLYELAADYLALFKKTVGKDK
jgi:hypothetical protein